MLDEVFGLSDWVAVVFGVMSLVMGAGMYLTGHVVEVPIPADVHDSLQIGGDRYGLVQYHFHAPSEHAVNGRRAAVEAHFVHTNAQGATAVVGVFYRRGPTPTRCWTGSCCRPRRWRARRPTPGKPARRRCSGTSGGSARSAVARCV